MAKSKRTPENRAKILQGLRLGMTYKLCAQYAGMSTQTLWDWIAKDPDLSDACKEAEGANAAQALATIIKAAKKGNWTAGAWMLERRHGYTRTEKVEHSGEVRTGPALPKNVDLATLEKLAEE